MKKIEVKEEYRYAVGGTHVITVPVGVHDAPDDAADWGIRNGKAVEYAAETPKPEEVAVPESAVKREKKGK